MRLLWAHEHDFAAISLFLSERVGTLCCHPCGSLWLEQRITGWRSGRSEGDSKSPLRQARPHGPLTPHAANIPSGSRVIPLVRPTGHRAFHLVRYPWIGCRSQQRGMGSPSSEDEGAVALPPRCCRHRRTGPRADGHACPGSREYRAGGSTDRPVPSPRSCMIGFSERGVAHNRALLRLPFFPEVHEEVTIVVDGPFHGQKPLVRLLRLHYPRWQGCQGVRGEPVPAKRCHLEEPSASPVQSL